MCDKCDSVRLNVCRTLLVIHSMIKTSYTLTFYVIVNLQPCLATKTAAAALSTAAAAAACYVRFGL